jgi:hypothetical protein
MAISPWHDEAKQDSPDGRFVAVYDRAMEIAMGGPTVGRLIIKAKNNNARIAEFPDANGSFVWAVDSSALAFPRWTPERMQRLMLIHVSTGTPVTLPGEYSVLQLQSFRDGLIVGVDSPGPHAIPVSINVPS